MKNKIIIYGLLAGASFLAYKHYTKKKVKAMEVVDAEVLNQLKSQAENPSSDKPNKFRLVKGGGKTIKVPVSSQTIRL